MADYSSAEVQKLTLMAAGNSGHVRDPAMQRMTKVLLSNEMNELLEPLRVTLQLDLSKFSDGIYCWRGFLYYKWGRQELWPRLITVLRAMKALKPQGKITADQAHYLKSITDALILGVKQSDQVVRKIIAIYDDAYAGLIERKDPRQFRDFLFTAPSRFVELGEKLGAMSHIVSFWRYRFSGNAAETLPDVEDLMVIFHDFAQSLGLEVASAW